MTDSDNSSLTDDELTALPTVDLHRHLVGSAPPHTVARLAARHPEASVPEDPDGVLAFYQFRDFAHFIEVYTLVSRLVRTPEDIEALVVGVGDDLASEGIPYAELTVTPYAHLQVGIDPDDLAAALTAGARRVRARTGVELAWVYDISAGDGAAGATATLDAALHYPPVDLVGFGLGGAETGVRRADFAMDFAVARAHGLHSVPHAGESLGPERGPYEIRAALNDLGAERIGHGVDARHDERLLRELAEREATLEVCPTSNLATGVVRTSGEHPLPLLLDAGVPVTLGSDDPPMFGTSLLAEYRSARDDLGLSRRALLDIVRTGIEASFAPPRTRRRLLDELVTFG